MSLSSLSAGIHKPCTLTSALPYPFSLQSTFLLSQHTSVFFFYFFSFTLFYSLPLGQSLPLQLLNISLLDHSLFSKRPDEMESWRLPLIFCCARFHLVLYCVCVCVCVCICVCTLFVHCNVPGSVT